MFSLKSFNGLHKQNHVVYDKAEKIEEILMICRKLQVQYEGKLPFNRVNLLQHV